VAVLVAMPVPAPRLRGLRIMRVLERECERLHRIIRAGCPRLGLVVVVVLALVLLGVNERCDDESENRHCGKERRPV
jgi:hypothetical protein